MTYDVPASFFRKSTEMDAALQKYLLLSGQQDSLRRRLSSSVASSSAGSSPSHSAIRLGSTSSSYASSPDCYFPTQQPDVSSPIEALPLPPAAFGPGQFAPSQTPATLFRTSHEDPGSDSELFDLNQAIKATLTELVNRDEVKGDESLRLWVQGRLMDTQLEMRRQRRRRSSSVGEGQPTPAVQPAHQPTSMVRSSSAYQRPSISHNGRSRASTTSSVPMTRRSTSTRGSRRYTRKDSYLMAGG